MWTDFCGGGGLVSSLDGTVAIWIHPSNFVILILVFSFLGPQQLRASEMF